MDVRQTTKSLLSAFVLLATTALPLAAAAPLNCEALRQWALDNKEKLPHDYAGLSALPLRERRAAYGILDSAEKAAYWQDRVASYLAAHPELKAEQVGAIRAAAAALRPEIYGLRKAGDEDPLAEVAKVAHAALGEQLVREVFYGLGPAEPGVPGLAGECDCRTYIADCDQIGYTHCLNLDGCTATTSGCGMGGSQACTKNCVRLP